MVSRRQFFHLKTVQVPHIRPPGAVAEFATVCTSCGDCAEACPHSAIQLAEGELPELKPTVSPCHWCADMPCIAACAVAALQTQALAPIGRASLHMEHCLTSQGILCDSCIMVCPTTARALRPAGRQPALDASRCVGCGLCLRHCPEEGAITITLLTENGGLPFREPPK